MRAVNLIPAEARGGTHGATRSGGAVYAVLGALAALVAMAALWATASAGVGDRQARLADLQQQAAEVEARASAAAPPAAVQQLRASRTATVRALAGQRENWAATLDALSRTLPADTTLSSLEASTTPSAGAAAPAAGSPAGPTIALGGCAPSQEAVAQLMPRLRTIPGVVGVTLVSSSVGTAAGTANSTDAAPAETCGGATFQLTLGLEAPAALAGPANPADSRVSRPTAGAPPAATTAVPGTPTAPEAGR